MSIFLVHIHGSFLMFNLGGGRLIRISQEEAMEIRKRIPTAHIRRTARQKSQRKRYFVEETFKVLALIQKLRKVED